METVLNQMADAAADDVKTIYIAGSHLVHLLVSPPERARRSKIGTQMPAGIFARMSGRFAKSGRQDGTSDRSALSHGCRGNHPARKGNASLRL